MTWKPKHPGWWAGALGWLFCVQLTQAQQATVEDLFEAGEIRIAQAAEQQEEIDEIAAQTDDLFSAYQQVLRENENSRVYNELLQAQVDGQNEELAILQQSLDNVAFIERQMLPLMTRMIRGLELFIEADLPFLLDVRRAEVARLRALLERADQSAAAQFRNVMEAWMVEMQDFGTSSEVYADTITINGQRREVDLLRIGRVALVYLTRDGTEAGVWDRETGDWVVLEDAMTAEIRTGIESIRTQQPALFLAPIEPPELGEDG